MTLCLSDKVLVTLSFVIVVYIILNYISYRCRGNYGDVITEEMTDHNDGYRVYDNGEYRDPGVNGLDRTDMGKAWYHVANRLVEDSEIYNNINQSIDIIKQKQNKKNEGLVFPDFYVGKQSNRKNNEEEEDILTNQNTDEMCNFYTDVLGNVNGINDDRIGVKKYIRERVLDGGVQCGCIEDKEKSLFTNDEIGEYRDKQLRFRDKINGTSAPAEDPVDRMNMLNIQGGINAPQQTIAEFYDSLVK